MPQETLNVLLALGAFAVLHSLMAAVGGKTLWVLLMGQRAYLGLYRLLYNVVSGLTLLPILALMVSNPGETVWQLEGIAAGILIGVRVLGLLGSLLSILHIDVQRFIGLRQAMAYFDGKTLPLPPEPLNENGVYGLVRHPLYLFGSLALWGTPVMDAANLGFVIGATIYFVAGAWLEERRMVRTFGATYVAYRQRVPYMVPFLKWPNGRSVEPSDA